ncbi:MAG TPA: lipoprotein [Candidimonas sp.]|nr:lipoprotein [Candidimonas sp.]
MQAPRTSTPARTVSRIVASFALLSTLLACGYKGPLYMPPPPAPDAALTTPPPAPANMAAPETPEQAGEAARTSPVQAK